VSLQVLALVVAFHGVGNAQGAKPLRIGPRSDDQPRGTVRKWPDQLYDTVAHGNVERLKRELDADPALLHDGFSISGTTRGKPEWSYGFTLLHEAAEWGQLPIVEELLRRGANVNARPVGKYEHSLNQTPLHRAARGRSHVLGTLLAQGAEIDAVDAEGNSPLRIAVLSGHLRAANILAKAGAKQDIFCAAGLGNVTLLARFLDEDSAEANARMPGGETPLHCAAATGELTSAKLLLARGAAIDPQENSVWGGEGQTPLHVASMRGHLRMCRLLVESGADLEMPGFVGPPLHWAVFHNDFELAEFLLQHGANVSSRDPGSGDTPLHTAARNGWIDMAKLLIQNGADVNAVSGEFLGPRAPPPNRIDERKSTPLDQAIDNRKAEMAQLLLTKDARLGRRTAQELNKLLGL
jgi:ankyrin repeat protein